MNPLDGQRARLRLLQMHVASGVGHIGGNLSVLDVLLCLYHDVLEAEDSVVLSKGHSAGALYVALWSSGRLREEDLLTFHRDNTQLAGHPPARGIPEVLFATGSLGHGLGLASGLALSRRMREAPGRVFCVMSDGEWNEGSSWEALIFARQQHLRNLIVIVDCNGLQGFGTTAEVADLAPLSEKLRTFGVQTMEVDGHDRVALVPALRCIPEDGPLAIVARTVKGRGVSFMENRMDSHYLPLTEAQYALVAKELEDA